MQHDVSTQADMFLACSSPKEPCTPAMEYDSAASFTDDTYVSIILWLAIHYIKFIIYYRLQEEYHPTDDTTRTEEEEEEDQAEPVRKEKFIVLSPASLSCLSGAVVVVKWLS